MSKQAAEAVAADIPSAKDGTQAVDIAGTAEEKPDGFPHSSPQSGASEPVTADRDPFASWPLASPIRIGTAPDPVAIMQAALRGELPIPPADAKAGDYSLPGFPPPGIAAAPPQALGEAGADASARMSAAPQAPPASTAATELATGMSVLLQFPDAVAEGLVMRSTV